MTNRMCQTQGMKTMRKIEQNHFASMFCSVSIIKVGASFASYTP